MAGLKAVKATKELVEGAEADKYDSDQLTDTFKGRIVILKPEESEVAKNIKINKKGTYAAKLG